MEPFIVEPSEASVQVFLASWLFFNCTKSHYVNFTMHFLEQWLECQSEKDVQAPEP